MTLTIDGEDSIYNFIDRIKNGIYDPRDPPVRPDKPHLTHNHNSEEAHTYSMELRHYEDFLSAYKRDMNVYANHKHILFQKFKKDALEYCGLTTHPKADKAFEYAWDGCSKSGMVQIVEYLEELSELMID